MSRRYVTIDVFTRQMFGGNPLAVVLDAEGLSHSQMQSLAREFNYAETTFVLPPRAAEHTAQVRIFTPRVEMPFAGHPNVGTAVVLARHLEAAGRAPREGFVFEETAGLVPVRLLREEGVVVGAEFTAPEPLSLGTTLSAADAAACVGLSAADIRTDVHAPRVVSVGAPFVVAELASPEALGRANPRLDAQERVLPQAGTDAIYVYVRGPAAGVLRARMFAPIDGVPEDPATGSATAAAIALLAALSPDGERSWRVEQGLEMGRPSLLLGSTTTRGGTVTGVRVGGDAVVVMHGTFVV